MLFVLLRSNCPRRINQSSFSSSSAFSFLPAAKPSGPRTVGVVVGGSSLAIITIKIEQEGSHHGENLWWENRHKEVFAVAIAIPTNYLQLMYKNCHQQSFKINQNYCFVPPLVIEQNVFLFPFHSYIGGWRDVM